MSMKRWVKIFLIGTSVILLFLLFEKKMEGFFLCLKSKPFEATAQKSFQSQSLEEYYATFKPFRDWEVEDLEIEARAAVSAKIDKDGSKKFLFKKNSKKILPIASLTKLMTALIALENYDLSQKVKISETAASLKGNSDCLRVGESFYVKDLLYSLLMESNNQAAQALSEIMGEKKFVELMNSKAIKDFKLSNTHFSNPTGLDPKDPSPPNYSTAEDLVNLTFYLLKEPLIWEILKTKEFELYTANGVYHHKIENNNKLLEPSPEVWWKTRIMGGKTGQTSLAGNCLLIVLRAPRSGFLVNVVLNSPDRFQETKNMIEWTHKAYKW